MNKLLNTAFWTALALVVVALLVGCYSLNWDPSGGTPTRSTGNLAIEVRR